MLFVQRRPAPTLDRFVEAIWFCRNDPAPLRLERVLPSGAAQIVINLAEDETRTYVGSRIERQPGAVISGIGFEPQVIDTAEQQHVAGISFRPGGTAAFFPMSAAELGGGDVALEALWGVRRIALLRERLLAAKDPAEALDALERELADALLGRGPHPAVLHALDCFRADPGTRVAAMAEQAAMSHRRFIERFRNDAGVTPKLYCRLLRFQKAVALAHAAPRPDWSQLALECGYFDQAHLIHDFRAFAGLTPAAYAELRTPFQNHVNFLQSDPGSRPVESVNGRHS